MKSLEQQPISESEKSPTNAELDIAAAKKYLEKVYGPEKSSIMVDKYISIEDKKPKIEEIKETPIVKEEADKKPITNELAENINKEKEMQGTQIESAKNELIDLAQKINEAREKNERKTETSLCDRAKEVFEMVTGKNLEKTAREKAKAEAENDGLKIFTPQEYRKTKMAETEERIRQKERSAVIKERWDALSDKEKERYFGESRDKNDPVMIDSARIKFAMELKEKIDTKKQELSKGAKGIVISEDVFYELMRKGLKSEDINRRGFFGRIFFGGEITIPPLDKTDGRGSLISDKEYLTEEMEDRVIKNIADAAQEGIERKIIEGQRRWRKRKQRHTREIIQETAIGFEAEKKLEVKLELKEERPSEIIKSLKLFKKVSDIEKVMKKVNSDIEAKKEQQKKIQKLEKKIEQGKILTSREEIFLNKIDSVYKKSA